MTEISVTLVTSSPLWPIKIAGPLKRWWLSLRSCSTRGRQRTRGIIGDAQLRLMKPTALLVNTSRGPHVDTDALLGALEAGRVRAAIDVYDQEPLPAEHPLRRAPGTLLTPHLGYVTAENMPALYASTVENLLAWLDGAPIRVVNG
jgi:phosphoglycerate dehydrogenase-like enzyme